MHQRRSAIFPVTQHDPKTLQLQNKNKLSAFYSTDQEIYDYPAFTVCMCANVLQKLANYSSPVKASSSCESCVLG